MQAPDEYAAMAEELHAIDDALRERGHARQQLRIAQWHHAEGVAQNARMTISHAERRLADALAENRLG